MLEAVARVPGVRSASVDGGAPLSGTASSTLYIEGQPTPPPGQAPPVLRHYIGPDHFRTLGIPLRRGRVFSAADVAGAPRVTVISETAARRFWPDDDPIGKRVWFGGGSNFDSAERSAEIVGIVGDVVYQPLDREPNFSSFYTPYQQFTYASRMVFLKTAGEPLSLVPDVRRAIESVDPELALRDVQPLAALVQRFMGPPPVRRDSLRRLRPRGAPAGRERHLCGAGLRGGGADPGVRHSHRPGRRFAPAFSARSCGREWCFRSSGFWWASPRRSR